MPFRIRVGAIIAATLMCASARADGVYRMGDATLLVDTRGYARLEFGSAENVWPVSAEPIVCLQRGAELLRPESIAFRDSTITATFADGTACTLNVTVDDGFALFDVATTELSPEFTRAQFLSLMLPPDADVLDTLNAGKTSSHTVALSAAAIHVHAFAQARGRHDTDRTGCAHALDVTTEAKVGAGAAQFIAQCEGEPAGWSYSGRSFVQPIDLTGLKTIRAWVHGDGQGELLKIQLGDSAGGARDTYIPIGFSGWQQVTVAETSYNTLAPAHVTALSLYYNGLPQGKSVRCLVDHIEAIVERGGAEQTLLLEDFEPDTSLFWAPPTRSLNVETVAEHGIAPARFGLMVSPNDQFFDTMERFERAAGIPSPRLDSVWNKRSPRTKRSYLFITMFSEGQTDDVIAMAKRGGFDTILILQDSWTKSTGHFEVNDAAFPGGLETLQRTVKRLKDAGFYVGFHFLGPSIYLNDPYVTPKPDARLFKNASAELAADIAADSTTILTNAAPETFPAEDGGYLGDGTIVQIDDELIAYGARSVVAPLGFTQCQRGALGTVATAHVKGATIHHLQRSYGYFLFDMDSTLIDEVTTNFARVANACDIDMIYFDGSERLQGQHWYYNARLHTAFHDKLARKDILLQASSFSHYSWHMLARSASADGHDDLKMYLDERSGVFDAYAREGMPLDVGWYYGYDPRATPDMFEYVLGATIGYNSSMSFQVSLDAANQHPFTGEILDLIARYETLRLSGRVPDEMRARLRIDPSLSGKRTSEERDTLSDVRHEYRLLADEGRDAFQRVVYTPWHEVSPAIPPTNAWTVTVKDAPAWAGVQIYAAPGPWLVSGAAYRAENAVTLEAFDDLAPYGKGATLDSVTHSLSLSDQAREGAHCAIYTVKSTRTQSDGWSVFQKSFNPPIDLSTHQAIGFWLKGDGNGGLFKLQFTDGANAADHYITNDYSGWRYQQLVRPQPDPMNYANVMTLGFYYNALPANMQITCSIDDVKALQTADRQIVGNPWVEIGGERLQWMGELEQGQYAMLWPGEPWRRYASTGTTSDTKVPSPIALPQGERGVTFGAGAPLGSPVRVRLTLQPPERHVIP